MFPKNWKEKDISAAASLAKRLKAFFDFLHALGSYHIDTDRNVWASAAVSKLYLLTALERAKVLSIDTPLKVMSLLTKLGIALRKLGDCQQAKAIYKCALAIGEDQLGKHHVNVAVVLANLGNALCDLGDYKKAKILNERALAITEKHFGIDHGPVASTLNSLGNALRNLGNYHKAEDVHECALAMVQKHFGKDHTKITTTLLNLTPTHFDLGNYKHAKVISESALAIQQKHFGKDHTHFDPSQAWWYPEPSWKLPTRQGFLRACSSHSAEALW